MIKQTVLATLAVGAALAAIGPAQAETYRFHRWLGDKHPINARTVLPWIAAVDKATEGRVKIEYTAAPLGPPPKQFEIVKSGTADFAFNVHGFTPGQFVLTQMGELPFLSRQAENLSVAFYRTYMKHFADKGEHDGTKVITIWTARPGAVWSTDKPIDSLDAWKGLKILGGNSINVEIGKALGASVVQAPVPEVYNMLQKRIVDAAFIDHSSYKDFNLQRFIKHTTEFPKGIYSGTLYIVMNQAKWDALSAADKAAIEKISGETLAREAGRNWDIESQLAIDQMKENKVNIIVPQGEYMKGVQDKLAFLETRWLDAAKAKGVDGKPALDMLKAEADKEAALLKK